MNRILIILEKKWSQGFICPYTGTVLCNIILFKHVYWYIQQFSGERLQAENFQFLKLKKSLFIAWARICNGSLIECQTLE